MAIRNIAKNGDAVLRKNCRIVEKFDEKLHILLDDMAETMHKADGVGLAAPQVSCLRRAVVIDVGDEHGLIELINPVITYRSEETQYVQEGCLSCPNLWGMTTRPMKIEVEAYDRNGKEFSLAAEGLLAQAICHETEHLDGKLFIDIVEEWVDPQQQAEEKR